MKSKQEISKEQNEVIDLRDLVRRIDYHDRRIERAYRRLATNKEMIQLTYKRLSSVTQEKWIHVGACIFGGAIGSILSAWIFK